MSASSLLLLALALWMVAMLYSSVGHAGASGYIAVMTLFSIAPDSIKPIALVLNIVVASITTWQFWRAGYFSWRLFWPFAIASIPLAFLGGALHLPSHVLKILLGVLLLLSALRFFLRPLPELTPQNPNKLISVGVGGGLGLLAGLTGTGGGIFLTPIMLFMRWGSTKIIASVSALFILVNSLAGLLGYWSKNQSLPSFVWPLVLSVVFGGFIGSYFGSRYFEPTTIKKLLAVVLSIAACKLIFT